MEVGEGVQAWTAAIMERILFPAVPVLKTTCIRNTRELNKNADSQSHPRPADFSFLGLGHRNCILSKFLCPLMFEGKHFQNLSANLSCLRHMNLMFQISRSSGYHFGSGILS